MAVDRYRVVYSEDRAKITQTNRSHSTTLEIIVSAEDDAELRQLTITNLEDRPREIDVTSYAEVVLVVEGRFRTTDGGDLESVVERRPIVWGEPDAATPLRRLANPETGSAIVVAGLPVAHRPGR